MPTRLEARVSEHDREIAAIRKLIPTGMKMIAKNDAQIAKNANQIKSLSVEVRGLAAMHKELMRSLGRRNGTNGRAKPAKGLQ